MALPDIINEQLRLLTIRTKDEPFIEGVLPGVSVQPLFLDAENGTWVLRAKFAPGTTLPKHFHTGTVHFWTLSGTWCYLEYPDDVQQAGDYLYEPGGSIHTFHVPEDSEGADGFMVVSGSNVNYDGDGNLIGIMDAGWIEQTILAVAASQGMGKPRYIHPSGGAEFST